ncbi:MAG: hypothetical protein WC485_03525 [Opitutaceae bacterium]
MKTSHSLLALSAVTLLLAATPILRAGPGAEYWRNRLQPAAQTATPPQVDQKQAPVFCPHSQCCGCAAMAAQKAKS